MLSVIRFCDLNLSLVLFSSTLTSLYLSNLFFSLSLSLSQVLGLEVSQNLTFQCFEARGPAEQIGRAEPRVSKFISVDSLRDEFAGITAQ